MPGTPGPTLRDIFVGILRNAIAPHLNASDASIYVKSNDSDPNEKPETPEHLEGRLREQIAARQPNGWSELDKELANFAEDSENAVSEALAVYQPYYDGWAK